MQVPAVRERVVSMLANVSSKLSEQLAAELGMDLPAPMPKALKKVAKPEIETSPALSIFAQPGDGSIRTRRIAILVADGVDGATARALHAGLVEQGAVPRYIGPRLGAVKTETATRCKWRPRSRRCRRCCSTRWRSRVARAQP